MYDISTVDAHIGLTSADDVLPGLSIAAIHVKQRSGTSSKFTWQGVAVHLHFWRKESSHLVY